MIYRSILVICCTLLFSSTAFGQIRSKAAREAAEYILERFGVEVGQETVETLSKRIGQYGVKYGDEAIEAIKSTGPRAFKLIDDAGENAPEVVRLLNKHGNAAVWVASNPRKLAIFVKYGDDAAEAMIKHPGVAGPVVNEFGAPAARAMRNVSSQNARRIAMMADDGILAATQNADGILDVVARFGDRAADWVWRHKGALAVAAIATAFVANPEPFLDGAVEIAEVGGEMIVRPVAEKAAESINWNLMVVLGIAVLFGLIFVRFGWRWLWPHRNKARAGTSKGLPEQAP